ncbi:MAG TPA: hypothetical protein VIM46_04850 [Luteolibacter sp.]
MQTLARFDAPEDAYLFRAFLESRGIAATVLDEYVAQLFWHYRNAVGGVRVVAGDDEDAAALEAATLEYFRTLRAGPEPEVNVRCWPLVLLLSWAVGMPLVLFGRKALAKRAS